jgi:hypothetical protein
MDLKDSFYGFTPLMLAMSPAQKKKPEHTEIARLLITKGAPGQEGALETAIRENDAAMATFILQNAKIPVASLTDSLEAARAQNKAEMVAMLEKAGAKPYEDFKLDPAYLAKLAGSYKNAGGLEFVAVVNGARLSVGPATAPPAQRLTLIALDQVKFRVLGAGVPGTATFLVENDKAVSLTLALGGQNIVLTRSEGK